MDPRSLIASRIDLHLRRQLGTHVDGYRALTDSRYMRDVLLVCDAMTGTELPLLARQFRMAGTRMAQEAQRAPGHDAGPPQDWAADTSGFGWSQPPEQSVPGAQGGSAAKPWFAPRRWFGR
jgi:hypothetical protein